jgi:hypothetical protein
MLDCAVGVLHELLGLATHEEQLLAGRPWAEGAVMEVLREVRFVAFEGGGTVGCLHGPEVPASNVLVCCNSCGH